MSHSSGENRAQVPLSRPFLRVARLLLMLPETLACLASLTCMSACILPLSPEFQDPPSSPNFAPVIIDTNPPEGSVLSRMPSEEITFRVTISDPNVLDNLYVRWVADYPPFSVNTRGLELDTLTHSADGTPLRAEADLMLSCLTTLAPIPMHQIVAIVADRQFDPTPGQITSLVDDNGRSVQVTWYLNLDCR